MPAPPARRRLVVDDLGEVSVVGFANDRILDDHQIRMIGDGLFRLVDELGRRNLLLNFGGVEFMSSAMLGKLIALQRKVQAARGRVVLCGVSRDILELFRRTRLDRLLPIVPHSDLAAPAGVLLEAFGDPLRPVAFPPHWRTGPAVLLARRMYASGEFGEMPLLADVLKDAGCDSDAVLAHCRGPGPHVRQCWVLDLVLRKTEPVHKQNDPAT